MSFCCQYAECHIDDFLMLGVNIMMVLVVLCDIILSVHMLCVILLCVVMLTVVSLKVHLLNYLWECNRKTQIKK